MTGATERLLDGMWLFGGVLGIIAVAIWVRAGMWSARQEHATLAEFEAYTKTSCALGVLFVAFAVGAVTYILGSGIPMSLLYGIGVSLLLYGVVWSMDPRRGSE